MSYVDEGQQNRSAFAAGCSEKRILEVPYSLFSSFGKTQESQAQSPALFAKPAEASSGEEKFRGYELFHGESHGAIKFNSRHVIA